MFGIEGFEPWLGMDGKYEASNPRVMVLGDTRLDAPLTDREAILRKIGGAPDLIFTNFEQAVLGRRHWEDGFRAAAYGESNVGGKVRRFALSGQIMPGGGVSIAPTFDDSLVARSSVPGGNGASQSSAAPALR